jgi:stage V sporulation protein SpoVS
VQLLEAQEQAQHLALPLAVLVAQLSKAFLQKMNINALTQAVCAIAVTILLTNFYNFLLYAL